jgi:hypothetical protein
MRKSLARLGVVALIAGAAALPMTATASAAAPAQAGPRVTASAPAHHGYCWWAHGSRWCHHHGAVVHLDTHLGLNLG